MANIRSEGGFTPLHFAVSGGNISAVKALLQYGAACNVQVGEPALLEFFPCCRLSAAEGHPAESEILSVTQFLPQLSIGCFICIDGHAAGVDTTDCESN